MTNNLVHLRGSFLISTVEPASRRCSTPTVRGWIFTDPTRRCEPHPFLAIDDAAEKMVEFGHRFFPRGFPTSENAFLPHFAIDTRGKLITFQRHSFLQVRNAFLIGTGKPISRQRTITTNCITLAGKILLRECRWLEEVVEDQEVEVLETVIATDKEQNGGHHLIRIQDPDALAELRKVPAEIETLHVTINGHLKTLSDYSYILAKFVNRDDHFFDGHLNRSTVK